MGDKKRCLRRVMVDKIKITGLEIFARHGVMPEETALGQKFIISAELFLTAEKAGITDNLEDSVNYALACECIKKYNEKNTKKLIEAAAQGTAENILLSFPSVRGVRLEMKKPNPPIHLHFDSVAVELERSWHRVFVAFGSNMGDSEKIIKTALDSIADNKKCRLKKVSKIIKTKPYGGVEQNDFLNGVAELETLYSSEELLNFLHVTENNAGRERKIHWGPRTLDLDIIFYDDLIIDSDNLVIPHPDMANRDFVVMPMCEIAPWFVHPVLKKSMNALKTILQDKNQ